MPVNGLTVLVVIETLVLVLLAFVMVGLLRSHAEILRRLPDEGHDTSAGASEPQPIVLEDRDPLTTRTIGNGVRRSLRTCRDREAR